MFEELDGFRHEFKYIEPEINLTGIQSRLKSLMRTDPHAGTKGYYSIRSLYFDGYGNPYLMQNIDGVDERTKWRIRIYNRDSSHISLERKIRKADLIKKQTCTINCDIYNKLINKNAAISDSNPALLNMFIKDLSTCGLSPCVIVEYDRMPFVRSEGNVRVTIDRNIRSSCDLDGFLSDEPIASRPVLPNGQNLIEVKYDAFLPDHIAHAIEHGRMRRETFSKYYLARKFPYGGRRI